MKVKIIDNLQSNKVFLLRTFGREYIIATLDKIFGEVITFKDPFIIDLSINPQTGRPGITFEPLCIFRKEKLDTWTISTDTLSNIVMLMLEESEIDDLIIQAYKNRDSKIITPPEKGIILPN